MKEPAGQAAGAGLPVMFIGDSITFAWPGLLSRPGLVNKGVPGETTTQMLDRMTRQLDETCAVGVHILGGVNDIAGNGGPIPLAQTRAQLNAMCRIARARGCAVWLGSVLPASGIWWNPEVRDARQQIAELNRGLRLDARDLGVIYLDYHRLLVDEEGGLRSAFGTDGLHLSPEGYAVITRAAIAALGYG